MNKPNSECLPDICIMVVDDQPDIRKLIELHLKRIGYTQILTAENGRQALDAAALQLPDLILMDIMMPVMDGLEACAAFKQDPSLADVPVIIVSAIDDMRNKAAAYSAGADDFLVKPLDSATLAARCRAVIKTRTHSDSQRDNPDRRSICGNLFDFQHLYERLFIHLEHCRRREIPFSMIYADIDYMKMINTTYNAHTGDKLIQQVRQIFYDQVENLGAVITSNSDKLIVLLPGVNDSPALALADKIINQVNQIVLPMEFETNLAREAMPGSPRIITNVSISMGIVSWEKVLSVPADKFLDLTESALRSAKEGGRDRKIMLHFSSVPEGDTSNETGQECRQ